MVTEDLGGVGRDPKEQRAGCALPGQGGPHYRGQGGTWEGSSLDEVFEINLKESK